MGWNGSDEDKNKKKADPWRGKQAGPPDLDEVFKRFQGRLKSAFGGNSGPADEQNNSGLGFLGLFVFLIILLLWALSGIFILGPAEEAVILRFGQYEKTVGPGPHWIPRFIESKYVRDVNRLQDFTYSSEMLTRDENIVSVSVAIQYKIGSLKDYLFNVADPNESLRQATASALRQVVGHTTLDQIITEGREVWARNVKTLLVELLNEYQAGIVITGVSPQPARAPDKVQDAFDDAIMAQEDEKRFKEKANAYLAKVVPIAQGHAKRTIEEAQAFSREVVFNATGAVAEFLALNQAYIQAPEVTRERLYLDAMQTVLTQTSKILVQGKSGKMVYLPIEKLLSIPPKNQTKVEQDELSQAKSHQSVDEYNDGRRVTRRLSRDSYQKARRNS